LPAKYDQIPESRLYPIVADSSRPETISYLRRHGYNKIKGSKKGAGSIEDGIAFIRSFEKVIIHPRCKATADEFRFYSYKVDPQTGAISNKIEDKKNHIIDALRYALEDRMRANKGRITKTTGW
jgi:phage terminase large subunit